VAARRELLEETGYVADVMTPLATFNASTGISNEVFHIFIATGLRSAGDPRREPTEQQMELIPMPLDRAARLAESGEMRDSSSALAVILANNRSRRT
jgi:ADP-ribose pyrophosphatase